MSKRRKQRLSDEQLLEQIGRMTAQIGSTKKSIALTLLAGIAFLAWFQWLLFPGEWRMVSSVLGWLLSGVSLCWTLAFLPSFKETDAKQRKNLPEPVRRLQIRAVAMQFFLWRAGVLFLLSVGLSLVDIATLSKSIPMPWATGIVMTSLFFVIALCLWKQASLLRARVKGWPFESWWSKALMALFYGMLGLIALLKVGTRIIVYYRLPTEKLALFVGLFMVYATIFLLPQAISDFLIARIQRKIQKKEITSNENPLEGTQV